MDGKTYQSKVILVKLEPEIEEMKTQRILKIVADALARKAAAQSAGQTKDERCDPSVEPSDTVAPRGRKVTKSGRCSASGRVEAA